MDIYELVGGQNYGAEVGERVTWCAYKRKEKARGHHQEISSTLAPFGEIFQKNKGGIFSAFFKFPLEKKNIFKENRKKFFPFRGKQGEMDIL